MLGLALAAVACGGSDGGAGAADAGPCPGCDDAGTDGGAPDAGPRLPEGAACEADAACEGGLCVLFDDGGACRRGCDDGDDCEAGETCGLRESPPGSDLRVSLCLPAPGDDDLGAPCVVDAECDARVCLDGQCTSVCDDDGDCLRGQRCLDLPPSPGAAPARLCGYAPIDGPTLESIPLFEGPLPLGGPRDLEDVGVAPDAVSLTFVARRLDETPAVLVFSRVVGPGASRMLSYAQILAYRDQPLRWLATPRAEAAAVVVPNTTPDRIFFSGGRWGVEPVALGVGEEGPDEIRVALSAEVKRAPGGVLDAGALDLVVWLVGVDLTAEDAPDDATLSDGLVRAGALLAGAGLDVGDVTYRDAPEDVVERLSIIESFGGGDSELAELFRLSGATPDPAIDVFLVRSLENDDASMTLGIAGDIPGPPLGGTSTSGVAVAFDMAGSSEDLGKVIAHELGHYLGLFHVRERLDPCAPGTGPTAEVECAPFGGGDVLEDTTQEVLADCPEPCDDARQFVMFWSLQRRADRSAVFSDGQGLVVRGHPLVR